MQVVPLVDIVVAGTAADMLAVCRAVGTAVVAGTVAAVVQVHRYADLHLTSRSSHRLLL